MGELTNLDLNKILMDCSKALLRELVLGGVVASNFKGKVILEINCINGNVGDAEFSCKTRVSGKGK